MVTQQDAQAAYYKYRSKRAAAKALNIPRTTFRRILGDTQLPKDEKIEKTFTKDSAIITTKSLKIKTVEDALREADVDLEDWEVDRYTINSWEVTIGAVKTNTVRPETYTNFQVKLWLKRKKSEMTEVVLSNLIDRINSASFKAPKQVKKSKEILLVPGLVDHHFGMLAWGKETGDGDYDLDIAEKLYLNALQQGVDGISNYEISQFLFPIGSDLFHINNPNNLTPKGHNHLDVDSRLAKVFETGLYSVINAIDFARRLAPVEIKWIPGNHDPETSFYLCKVIDAYYRDDPYVVVDVSPKCRKFYKWNNTLIGMCHGDEEPHQKLPTIMADSVPHLWAECKYKEWLIGHVHKKKELNFIGVDSFGSTIVRFLPSLCKIDHWHYKKGYVGGNKSMEMLAYGKNGLQAYFPIYYEDIQ